MSNASSRIVLCSSMRCYDPSLSTTNALAKALGVPVTELAGMKQRYISNELTHFVGRSLRADENAQYDLLVWGRSRSSRQ